MEILTLRTFINRNFITSEHLHPMDMLGYMDLVIDDINDALQACFPTFSEWAAYCEVYNETNPDKTPLNPNNYNAFPDSYLRKVVAPGAAMKFYSNDEEGEQVASKFYIDYEQAKALMARDYISQVPEHFQNNDGGYIEFEYEIEPTGMETYYVDREL